MIFRCSARLQRCALSQPSLDADHMLDLDPRHKAGAAQSLDFPANPTGRAIGAELAWSNCESRDASEEPTTYIPGGRAGAAAEEGRAAGVGESCRGHRFGGGSPGAAVTGNSNVSRVAAQLRSLWGRLFAGGPPQTIATSLKPPPSPPE